MLNVLYLHNSSLISGGERSLLQLWAHLDRKSYTPHVVLPGDGVFAQEIRRLGIDVAFLDVPPLRPWSLPGLLRARQALADMIHRKDVRLVHSYAPRNNLLASWVGRSMQVPVIWHERNLLWRGEMDISRMFLGWPDALICNSQAVAERFKVNGRLPDKVRVVLNGVDFSQFTPAANKSVVKERLGWAHRKVVGLVTNLEPRKGVETFLEIAAGVMREHGDVLFVVVGGCYGSDDRRMEALRQKAIGLGLGENLVWIGFQPDVRPYMGAFDVSVHVTEKEACARAILESMSMRLAVVAFNDGGNPELVVDGQTGVLVPAGRVDVFVECLISLLGKDVELVRMGQAGRLRVQELFDVGRNAAQTQAIYHELSGERP